MIFDALGGGADIDVDALLGGGPAESGLAAGGLSHFTPSMASDPFASTSFGFAILDSLTVDAPPQV